MGFHEVEHLLEAFRAAVVRVGHVAVAREEPDLRLMRRSGHALQRAQVSPIHRQDHVEFVEVMPTHLPRTLRAQVVAAPAGMVLGALVGRLADVPVAQAGRFDAQFNELFLRQLPQDRLGGGRPADVAGTDEQDRAPFHMIQL